MAIPDWLKQVGEGAIGVALPFVKKTGKEKLVALFDKLYEKNPDTHKTTLATLYPAIDIQLEDLANDSKTPYDDVLVDGLKEAIEESAAKYSVDLPNLDND